MKLNITKKFQPYLFALSFGIIGTTIMLAAHADTQTPDVEVENGTISGAAVSGTDSTASGSGYVKFGHCTNPTVSATLVPSCGAWLGGFANNHGSLTAFKDRILDLESREGRALSLVHGTYHSPTQTSLSSDEQFFINRANTYLVINYKPAIPWSDGDGSNATTNSRIDTMAASIKAVAPKKIIILLGHEPENDVSSGAGSGCGASPPYASGASAGSPADYRAMWANVQQRFSNDGVTNVVWGMDYMSDSKFACFRKDLWPGNNLVDWVFYDKYPGDSDTWASGIGYMYNWMTSNNDVTHDFLSKPWGIGEWGSWATTTAKTYQLYSDGAAAIANGTMPNLRAYMIFDAIGTNDSRIDYDSNSTADPTELQHYQSFVQSSGFVQP